MWLVTALPGLARVFARCAASLFGACCGALQFCSCKRTRLSQICIAPLDRTLGEQPHRQQSLCAVDLQRRRAQGSRVRRRRSVRVGGVSDAGQSADSIGKRARTLLAFQLELSVVLGERTEPELTIVTHPHDGARISLCATLAPRRSCPLPALPLVGRHKSAPRRPRSPTPLLRTHRSLTSRVGTTTRLSSSGWRAHSALPFCTPWQQPAGSCVVAGNTRRAWVCSSG